MAKNLLCSVDRVGMHNWFVIAFDARLCPVLREEFGLLHHKLPLACTYPYTRFDASVHGTNTTTENVGSNSTSLGNKTSAGATQHAAAYRSRLFNAVVFHRVGWLRLLVAAGYNVLHCDADVVWLRNPLPLFEQGTLVRPSGHTSTYREADFLVQSEGVYGNNGGFYFVRPSNRTVTFFDALLRKFHERSRVKNKNFEDQHCLNDVLRDARKRRKGLLLKAPKLNESLFPNGAIWQAGRASKADAYVVHMNWAKQSKKTRFVSDGLWFLSPDDTRCAANFDPYEGNCNRHCVALKPGTGCELGKPCELADCATVRGKVGRRGGWKSGWHAVAHRRAGCPM